MKTDSKNIAIEDVGLNIQDGQHMILGLINHQINNYKLKHLTNWEQNNTSPLNPKDEKIERLEKIREELFHFFRKYNSGKNKLNFSINVDLDISDIPHKTIQSS